MFQETTVRVSGKYSGSVLSYKVVSRPAGRYSAIHEKTKNRTTTVSIVPIPTLIALAMDLLRMAIFSVQSHSPGEEEPAGSRILS